MIVAGDAKSPNYYTISWGNLSREKCKKNCINFPPEMASQLCRLHNVQIAQKTDWFLSDSVQIAQCTDCTKNRSIYWIFCTSCTMYRLHKKQADLLVILYKLHKKNFAQKTSWSVGYFVQIAQNTFILISWTKLTS